jgi:hypothetical protein
MIGLRAGMTFLYLTFGCVLSVGLWSRPIVTNATFATQSHKRQSGAPSAIS